jgi:glycosyltransferase involved in cell wall biosynthesis
MKILHISPGFLPSIGGLEIGLYNLCKSLSKIGVEPYVLTTQIPSSKSYEEIDSIRVFRYKPNKLIRYLNGALSKFTHETIPRQHAEVIFKTLRLIKSEDIDIVHVHYFQPLSILGYLAKKTLKKPLVITLVGYDVYDPIEPVNDNLWRYYSKIINYCDRVIAVSNFISKILKKKIGRKDIIIIPYGVDTTVFKPLTDIGSVREIYGINTDDKVVIAVQQLRRRKKVEILLYAAKEVINEFPNTKFLIIGDGPEREKLENLTEKLHIAKNVIFTGTIQAELLPRCYSCADIFSMHTLHEGLGIVYLEAMAMELPIVTTYARGNEDIIENGKNGFMVEANNPGALAEKMVHLLSDDDVRRKIGQYNRREVIKRYDWSIIAERTKMVYEGL